MKNGLLQTILNVFVRIKKCYKKKYKTGFRTLKNYRLIVRLIEEITIKSEEWNFLKNLEFL